MIPSKSGLLNANFAIEQQPSRTYQIHPLQNAINGYCDNIHAVEQAIYKILNTERYQHFIYSHNYGVELSDLFGEPITYVCPELERRISEAVTQDERINSVTAFNFDVSEKRVVKVTFTAHTIYGDTSIEKVVKI